MRRPAPQRYCQYGYTRVVIMLGLKRGIVKLVPHQSQWRDEFEKEKKHLLEILKIDISIEHVGSTAIGDLDAKPIIDIILGLTSFTNPKSVYKILRENGYEDKGEEVEGEYLFVKGTELKRTHHLHIIEKDSDIWNNYLLFRDYLMQNKNARDEYNLLKQALAKKYPTNREEYTNGKAEFINRVLSGDFTSYEE